MSTHRAAVLGSPIAHSLSPVLHRAAYAAAGLTGWTYDVREVRECELAEHVAGLDGTWAGLSLTMPLKERALTVATRSTPLALQVGAANTLLREADGSWLADNTDVEGVRAALVDAGVGQTQPARTATVLGSGATARSVLAALAELGVARVTLVVRSNARERTLAQAQRHGFEVTVVQGHGEVAAWADADVLVSTAPAGGSDATATALSAAMTARRLAARAPGHQVVLDVVYAGWPTQLAQVSRRRGATVVNGVEMLIHQAASQFTLMTGLPAPLPAMSAAGRAAVAR